MTNWKKETPIEGGSGGCACCGYQYSVLPMDAIIAVGFGCANVTKNDAIVYDEIECGGDPDKFWTCEQAEQEARKDPDNDWRIHLIAPLSERHYQRQGENNWVLYKRGEGFA